MASFIDRKRISSALLVLKGKSWGDNSPIYAHLKDFGDAIEYLSMFVDCIHRWSDARVIAPHFGSLAAKIEATVEKTGAEFIEEVKRASVFKVASFNLLGTDEGRAWTWEGLFEKWKAMIDVLKPEISEACDSVLTADSVKYNSTLFGFCEWKAFFRSINFLFPGVNDKVLSVLEDIFDFLEYGDLQNPKIKGFFVKVGSSIISAGMLSCQWWAKNFDSSIKEDVDAAFWDLEQKFGLSNPDFIDILLRKRKDPLISDFIAGTIATRLIPFTAFMEREDFIYFRILCGQLQYLVIDVLRMPEEDALLQIFLPDIKQLLMEIGFHHHSLFDVKNGNVIMDLVGKVCLIKVEIFLRTQLDDNAFTLNEEIGPLNQLVFEMEEAISLYEAEGSERCKFANQILMLLKEVAIDVQKYQQSALSLLPKSPLHEGINKERLRLRLLLKALLLKGELLFLKLHDKLLPSFKDRTEDLHLGFKIMIPFVIKDEKLKFSDVEVVATRIISLYRRMLNQDISEEISQSMNRSVSDLADELKFVIEQFKEIHPRVPNSDFPKTNAAGFIDSLMRKLQDLLNYGMDLAESVISKGQIAEITEHLQFFKTFLGGNSSMEVSNLCARVINMCYETEYLIDSAIHGKEDEWHCRILAQICQRLAT